MSEHVSLLDVLHTLSILTEQQTNVFKAQVAQHKPDLLLADVLSPKSRAEPAQTLASTTTVTTRPDLAQLEFTVHNTKTEIYVRRSTKDHVLDLARTLPLFAILHLSLILAQTELVTPPTDVNILFHVQTLSTLPTNVKHETTLHVSMVVLANGSQSRAQ